MVDGQATKQRIVLIEAYVAQIKKFLDADAAAAGELAQQLLKHYIIELINSLNNSNPKVRALASEVFRSICEMMRVDLNMINQLFSVILVGLAAKQQSTQASTIRALIFAIKENVVLNPQEDNMLPGDDDEELMDEDVDEDDEFHKQRLEAKKKMRNKLVASEQGFQDFLLKASKIVSIFLKDKTTSHELCRAVLSFLRVTGSLLSEDNLKGTLKHFLTIMCEKNLNETALSKHRLLVRKVISKFVRRVGEPLVRKSMPAEGKRLLAYVERMRRKK